MKHYLDSCYRLTLHLWASSIQAKFGNLLFLILNISKSDSLQPHGLQRARLPCPSHLLEFAQTQVHWVGEPPNCLLCCPILLLLSIFPSIRVFPNESALRIRWPKYWSFSISPSNEYSELTSFRTDWYDLAVQGTFKSLLQHHSSKASILLRSALLMV